MTTEIELAEIRKDLKYIRETVYEIKTSVYGNGSKGLQVLDYLNFARSD